MPNIFYNGAVAKYCGPNGIIKAVLLNYIYHYHKSNVRKKVGDPAQIRLAEFVYRYQHEDTSLWKRSFIHKILTDLVKDKHLSKTMDNNQPVYSVSANIAALLNNPEAPVISFDLGLACEQGINIAIMSHYLKHVISCSPKGVAYGLDIPEMAELNRLSPAQIYRAIKYLVDNKVVRKMKSAVKGKSRALALSLYNSKEATNS